MGNFSKPERRRLDSIGTLWFKGQPFKKTDIIELGKYPCLHYGELFSKYGAIIDSVSSRCDVLPKRLSQKGDILFPASDVTPAGLARCSAIMQEDVILGGDVIGFRPQTGLNPIYLSYAIRHQKAQLLQRVTGALIKHISAKSLQSVIIPIHPIESQNRFEKQVRHLNRIISHRRTQLAKLDELVKCRFVEMFGDPVTNPMNWNVCKLVNACTKLTDGTHSSPENLPEGDFKYVTAKNIKRHGFDFSEITYINEKAHQGIYARCNPEYGDVLYIKDGVTTGIAMVNTLHEEFSLLSSVALLKPCKQKLDSHFLSELLNNDEMYAYVRKGMGGAAITRLTLKKIGDIQIPLPDLALQNSFSSFVQRIDKLRFVIQKSLDETQTLFNSLMQQYFD